MSRTATKPYNKSNEKFFMYHLLGIHPNARGKCTDFKDAYKNNLVKFEDVIRFIFSTDKQSNFPYKYSKRVEDKETNKHRNKLVQGQDGNSNNIRILDYITCANDGDGSKEGVAKFVKHCLYKTDVDRDKIEDDFAKFSLTK